MVNWRLDGSSRIPTSRSGSWRACGGAVNKISVLGWNLRYLGLRTSRIKAGQVVKTTPHRINLIRQIFAIPSGKTR